METRALGQVHWHPRRANVAATTILQVGALAGIAAGLMYAAWQVVVAAIAQDRTAVRGIHQTLWTPPQGIWSVVFGVHHFHGSFHLIPVLGGIVAHLGNSLILGILGVALLIAILGRRPNPAAAVVLGVAYGIAVDAILITGSSIGKRSRRSTARRRTGAGGSLTGSSASRSACSAASC